MSSSDDQSSLLDIALQQAIIHHRAGRMPEAEQSYRDILQTEPNCPKPPRPRDTNGTTG